MDQRSDASTQSPSTGSPKAPRPQAQSHQSVEGSVKDTIESILVAFMLAFIFRAFVVEAFVIPTGSMAPTLLGAHMRFRCPDCGYRFDVNFPTNSDSDDVMIPASSGEDTVFSIFCPNCGYRMPRSSSEDPDNDATNIPVRYGDRILVLKYLYLFQEPRRWDVVVFKSPVDPSRFDYSQNYIKRLVGKPGETIMVLDGDVYVGHGEAPKDFQIQTKPPRVQDALWRIVHDTDYQPRRMDRKILDPSGETVGSDLPYEDPWKQQHGQTGWTIGDAQSGHRNFAFANPAGSSTLFFDPSANPTMNALTDWLAYDVTENQGIRLDRYRNDSPRADNNVSDIKLDFYYERQEGAGALSVQVSKLNEKFEAQINPGSASLLHNGQPVAPPAALPHKPGPIHVQLINVDYRVSLVIDGVEVAATTPQQYHPDIDNLLLSFRKQERLPKPEIHITAENQNCVLSHVSLWRDVYYRNIDRLNEKPVRWASPNQLMVLKKDEFFVMGDNSQVSLDARYWSSEISLPHEDLKVEDGRVPRRFMMGKAFFVYWPAGYRPIDAAPALAPNFGDMRFIH